MNSIKYIIGAIFAFLIALDATSQRFEAESELVKRLNSPFGEEFLSLHPSGNEVAFTRLSHPYNQGGSTDAGDIWKSQLDSIWTLPINWHEVNTEHFSSPIGYSSDGSAFIYSKVSTKGGALSTELWIVSQGQTQNLKIKYFNNKSTHQSGCLSADNRFLIISMESGATHGVEDLYMLKREGDGWSAPKNLGSQLNTEFQEITPFLSADNRTLYFSTNGRKGEGSFDIYSSERLDDSWRNWSTPTNLGPAVNTSGRETSFSFLPDADYAYFVSTQNSDGYGDIRRVKFSLDSAIQVIEADTAQLIQVKELPRITGARFVNAKNSEPISKIEIHSLKREIPLKNGVAELMPNQKLSASATGFMQTTFLTFKDSLVTVRMEPLEIGRTIQLEHVLFSRGTANIIESSFEELDLVVKMMSKNEKIRILLKGHTDGNGDEIQNVKLSESRVKAVKAYLTKKGISKKRIEGIGLGGEFPISSNETEATRKLNRRVEFEIVE